MCGPHTQHREQRSPAISQRSPGCQQVACLVIGYGNPLRGDDAAGQIVAERVEQWQLPSVAALCAHQLLPELAEPLAGAACAIFVDASLQHAQHVCVQAIAPAVRNAALGHVTDPRELLALAEMLYGACPRAWCVHIPALQFGFGAELSPETSAAVAVALRVIRRVVMRQLWRGENREQRTENEEPERGGS
jgi:hydrogenase maturation protease